ncbi:MAG: MmgE/PrpD family protein, partial [Pseudomonadota bacterium]
MSSESYAIDQLAEWVHTTGSAGAPAEVMHQAKRCVLDAVACATAGYGHPSVAKVSAACRANFSGGSSEVWFSRDTLSPVGASMINANASSILDLDDGNRQAMGHPGGAVVPAVLAVGQQIEASPSAMLRAIIVGYEVAVRVGAAEQRSSYHSGNFASFGVAAAIGVLKGLDPQKIAHALGVVAYYGPRVSDLTLSNEMSSNVKESMPWSVVAGAMAADLAAAGFTGIRDALDNPERIDKRRLLNGLGDSYAIDRTYFKKYSCCRWIHSAVEALVYILEEKKIQLSDVEQVNVETFSQARQLNNATDPDTLEGAQYSVPFCLGVAAVHGEEKLMPLTRDILGDPAVVEQARKVSVVSTDRMDAMFPDTTPAEVVIVAGGERFHRSIEHPWGDACTPPADDELVAKFHAIAKGLMPETRVSAIANCILDDAGSIRSL